MKRCTWAPKFSASIRKTARLNPKWKKTFTFELRGVSFEVVTGFHATVQLQHDVELLRLPTASSTDRIRHTEPQQLKSEEKPKNQQYFDHGPSIHVTHVFKPSSKPRKY